MLEKNKENARETLCGVQNRGHGEIDTSNKQTKKKKILSLI